MWNDPKLVHGDDTKRVVHFSNLQAMCERASGMCHRYSARVTKSGSVYVEYSNPDEWVCDHPVEARLPSFPSPFGGKENPYVVLEVQDIRGNSSLSYANQVDDDAFIAVTEMEPLFRCPRESCRETDTWHTRSEAETCRDDAQNGHIRKSLKALAATGQ